MADGDRAQWNALAAVFGHKPDYRFLMCFFHAMKKVQPAAKPFSSGVEACILREVHDLHFARTETAYLSMRDTALKRWRKDSALIGFANDMCAQWLAGRLQTWKAFAIPSGFATSNNPAETFNALLKRDYTLRRRLKMNSLLRELVACCQDQSSSSRAFAFGVSPAPTLSRRVVELVRARYMGLTHVQNLDSQGDETPSIVRAVSVKAPRVQVTPNKRREEGIAVIAQLGANYARMEIENQPTGSWPVNIDTQWCP